MAGNDTATSSEAQDIASRIEQVLEPEMQNEPEIEAEAEAGQDEYLVLPDSSDSDEDEVEGESEGETEEVDEEDLTLAGYLGVDEEKLIVKDDGSVVFNAVIDGEAQEVNLKELAKSYQLQGHVNNKSISLENDKKEFVETRNKAYSELTSRLDGVKNLNKVMEEQLLGEYNSIDWNALRVTNPSEWAALKQEFAERAQKVQQAGSLAEQEAARLAQEQQAINQQARNEYNAKQYAQIVENNPTWSDEAVMTKEVGEIGTFLTSNYGFNNDELAAVTDSRLIHLVQDAMAFRKGKQGIAEKKLKPNLPKFQKPAASRASSTNLAKARAVKAKRQAVKKSGGSVGSVADSILDRM